MTKIVSLNEAQTQLQGLLALARSSGDEVTIEENGEPSARIVPIQKNEFKERVLGLREGQIWTSDDFDEDLPDEFRFAESK
jgi:prevent-host-death family protein